MCGIYGFGGRFENPHSLMSALTVMNNARGTDSAGMFTVRKDGSRSILKKASHPSDFIQTDEYFSMTHDPEAIVMVGHNRFATSGKVNKRNSHPFKIGRTIGVHNGSLGNLGEIRKVTGQKFAVDSQYLIWMLENFGDLGPAEGKLNVAYHQEKGCADLHILRHNHPLWFAYSDKLDWFAFSSEGSHLEVALSIAGIPDGAYDLRTLENHTRLDLFVSGLGTIDWQIHRQPVRLDTTWYGKFGSYTSTTTKPKGKITPKTSVFADDSWGDRDLSHLPLNKQRKLKEGRSLADDLDEYQTEMFNKMLRDDELDAREQRILNWIDEDGKLPDDLTEEDLQYLINGTELEEVDEWGDKIDSEKGW